MKQHNQWAVAGARQQAALGAHRLRGAGEGEREELGPAWPNR